MALSISNIAWSGEFDLEMYTLMSRHGFKGLEIAPSRFWSDPENVPEESISKLTHALDSYGIEIVSMQSLLFWKQGLSLFWSETERRDMGSYLEKIILLASRLKAKTVVFWSPKNRTIPDGMPLVESHEIASNFFRSLAEFSANLWVAFCLEPNPKDYGTNFLNATWEVVDFVKEVDHPWLLLNLDLGAIKMNSEPLDSLNSTAGVIGHVHISEKNLWPIDTTDADFHSCVAKSLAAQGYRWNVSIEMKNPWTFDAAAFEQILAFVAKHYPFFQ